MSDAMNIDVSSIDFSSLPAAQLEALSQRLIEERVERLIEEQAPLRKEYGDLRQRITSAVEPYGLDASRFLSMSRPQLQRHLYQFFQNQQNAAASNSLQRRAPKVAPKYRHPEDPSLTWTGRGNKPRWVKDWIDAGRSLQEIAVKE